MRLRNKKTGEIVDDGYVRETHDFRFDGQKHVLAVFKGDGHRPPERVSGVYISLAELNAEWEDAPEEPKEYWYIYGNQVLKNECDGVMEDRFKEIGNYFETREEAEKAVEKLKAAKRLKEANIDYKLSREYDDFTETMHANVSFSFNSYPLVGKDLDLLFSGEKG